MLTVRGNVESPARIDGVPKSRRRGAARASSDMVDLADFADKRPNELSGRMRTPHGPRPPRSTPGAEVLLMRRAVGALDAMTRDLLPRTALEALWTRTGSRPDCHAQRPRAVRLWKPRRCCHQRPGRIAEEYKVDAGRPRRFDSPGRRARASITDQPLRGGGAAAMATLEAELAGLDALELAVPTRRSRASSIWYATCEARSRRDRASVWEIVV